MTAASSPELAEAMQHYAAGRWAQAEQVCATLLAREPDNAAALHLRGAAAARAGRVHKAIDHLRRAVAADSSCFDAWVDLASLLDATGGDDEAIHCLEAAARLRPDPAQLFSLGSFLLRRGRNHRAFEHYERAMMLNPADAALRCRISQSLLDALEPECAELAAREAVRIEPGSTTATLCLAEALLQQNRVDEAIECFEQVLKLDPRSASAHSKLGEARARLGQMEEAEALCRRAIELDATDPRHWADLANVLLWNHRASDALEAARHGIELNPGAELAHTHAGQALLMMGRFKEGWAEYEWRVRGWPLPPAGRKIWDGSPLNGDALLLRAEQGIGDTIQFVRYAALVRQRGGRVIVESPPETHKLLEAARDVEQVVAPGQAPPDVKWEVWMMSLAHRFGTTLQTIPAEVPYLTHDPARAQRLRPFVETARGVRIGLVWAGNPKYAHDRQRSCPFEAIVPLTRVAGVTCFSLQRGPTQARDAARVDEVDMINLANECRDIADLAAAIALLDLVVTVETSAAQLAGALARPVWTLLGYDADWRWMTGRNDSPWYPSMRLFRQPARGDWDSVIREVAEALRREVANRVNSAS